MKLRFLGTRGNIETSTNSHRHHSSLKISYYDHEVIIDCGEDWLGQVADWDVNAILVTHAHPDHAFGLKKGAPCAVYATSDAWQGMEDFNISDRRVLIENEPTQIPQNGDHAFEVSPYPVLHSTRAPAVGFQISAGKVSILYVPDVAWIEDREEAMREIKVYIGDGATLKQSMVRKPDATIIGHVPIQTQLTWCQKTGVPRAIFTHLGSEIVDGDERQITQKIFAMAEERNIEEVLLAQDDMTLILR